MRVNVGMFLYIPNCSARQNISKIKVPGKLFTIDTCARFFFLEWIFVRKVHLSSSSVNFHFNPPSQDFYSFPFHARLEIEEIDTDKKYFWEQKDFKIEKDLSFDLESLRCPDHYKISFFLDDNLIYRNTYQELLEILF